MNNLKSKNERSKALIFQRHKYTDNALSDIISTEHINYNSELNLLYPQTHKGYKTIPLWRGVLMRETRQGVPTAQSSEKPGWQMLVKDSTGNTFHTKKIK